MKLIHLLRHSLFALFLTIIWVLPSAAQAQPVTVATNQPSPFAELIKSGNTLFKSKQEDAALEMAKKAIQLDGKRYEGYALAALVLEKQGYLDEASQQAAKALEVAPANKKANLTAFRDSIEKQKSTPTSAPALTAEARRKYDVLMLIIEDADKSKAAEERQRLLWEFMSKSAEFLVLAPSQTNIVVMRGAAAVELDYATAGQLAGFRLKYLGLEDSNDPAIRKVFAGLDRKGWLVNRLTINWNHSVDQTTSMAQNGNIMAQDILGATFAGNCIVGNKVVKDLTEAVKWYRKAAEQGDTDAEINLGLMYANGSGVTKDEAEAVKWYRKAADQGYPGAQYYLGWMYENGSGVTKDEAEAVKWYRKAAGQGDANSQSNLGLMYANGSGVTKDEAEAVKWYRKAADQGDANAKAVLKVLEGTGK